MTLFDIMPILASIAVVAFTIQQIIGENKLPGGWLLPAVVGLLFFGWSLTAVIIEGPTGFWPVHTENFWGNQVWFDLLLAVGIGWYLILPRAKAQNMNLYPWLAFICATGCIGFLAMVARLAFLESRRTKAA